MNDSRVLQLFNLYKKEIFDGFFDYKHGSQDGIHPYISGDKHYLLVPYLMIPHK